MSKMKSKYDRPLYDEDGVKKSSLKEVKRDRDKKRQKNMTNAFRSRDLDMIRDFEED